MQELFLIISLLSFGYEFNFVEELHPLSPLISNKHRRGANIGQMMLRIPLHSRKRPLLHLLSVLIYIVFDIKMDLFSTLEHLWIADHFRPMLNGSGFHVQVYSIEFTAVLVPQHDLKTNHFHRDSL